MTDHADTIRALISALKEGWPDESTVAGNYTRREIVSALEDLVVERQQAIDERDTLGTDNQRLAAIVVECIKGGHITAAKHFTTEVKP